MASDYKVGYGAELDLFHPSSILRICMSPLKRLPHSPFVEAAEAAKKVFADFGGVCPKICLSGGIDSEFVALAFLDAGIYFEAYTLQFKNDLNSNETKYAIEFCQKHNINHHLIDLDIIDFFQSGEYKFWVESYGCHLVETAAHLWFLNKLGNHFVWGGEPCRYFTAKNTMALQTFGEVECVYERFVRKNNLNAVANFHFYCSELVISFLKQSLLKPKPVIQDDHSPQYYTDKLNFYIESGAPKELFIQNRSLKLHGFEQVKEYFDVALAAQKMSYSDTYRKPVVLARPTVAKVVLELYRPDPLLSHIFD